MVGPSIIHHLSHFPLSSVIFKGDLSRTQAQRLSECRKRALVRSGDTSPRTPKEPTPRRRLVLFYFVNPLRRRLYRSVRPQVTTRPIEPATAAPQFSPGG